MVVGEPVRQCKTRDRAQSGVFFKGWCTFSFDFHCVRRGTLSKRCLGFTEKSPNRQLANSPAAVATRGWGTEHAGGGP
eukprot:1186394-Prorocentrum_minimum.AAC.3